VRGAILAELVLLLFSCSCSGGSDHEVLVELVTDLVPGVEFTSVSTSIEDPLRVNETAAIVGDDFVTGQRVAELLEVPNGTRLLTVRLLQATGELVAERRVRVEVNDDIGVTVLVTRDCQSVTCGEDQSCLGGTCVSVECGPATSDPSCGPAECAADSDCPAMADCARPRCTAGQVRRGLPLLGRSGGSDPVDTRRLQPLGFRSQRRLVGGG
jgi:hypothetical protein